MVRDLEAELEVSLPGIFSLHLCQCLLSSGFFGIWILKNRIPEVDSVGFRYSQNLVFY